MMFRRLYWTTEQSDASGAWRVTGVYTSISDLVDSGLRWIGDGGRGFRVSLVKLDCSADVLGSWTSPRFEGFEKAFVSYIQTGEFSEDDRSTLRGAMDAFGAPVRK